MSDPRKTGTSSITGKTVVVRRATESDLADVGEYLKNHHADSDLGNAEVVVADENRRIIGFGILKKENDAGCVSLFEDSRRKGIGTTIIRHLMDNAGVERVYASRYVSYFTHSDFARTTISARAKRRPTGNAESCGRLMWERLALAAY